MTKQQILAAIDEATAPRAMSPEQALEFMEELITDLEMKCDALKSDMED